MKKKFKNISIWFMCSIMLLAQVSGVGYSTKVYAATTYILDDAFVSNYSGQSNTIMYTTTPTKLIVGKGRHAYMKFDLSTINLSNIDKIVLSEQVLTTATNTLVYNESSNYLRSGTVDSTTLWGKENITYNNRPLDLPGAVTYTTSITTAGKYQIDLTDLFTNAINNGRTSVTVHFTTAAVNDTTVSANDIASTRTTATPATLMVTPKNAEVPVQPTGNNIGDYLENASIATKTFKMKNFNGDNNSYVKVQSDGSLRANASESNASIFALYVYQYDQDKLTDVTTDDNYGATITTYAIKCLDNNKYLSIQNYFSETDTTKPYYNKVDANTFQIKAVADDVNYNERFYLNQYATGGYYNIYSHLDTLRDDPTFSKTIIRADANNITCNKSNTDDFKFQFVDVSNQDQLEVVQKVSGTSAILRWKAVNGDTNTANYSVSGNPSIIQSNGIFTAQIGGLAPGKKSITVTYSNGSTSQSDTVDVRVFNHPGLLHSEEELDTMKQHVANKDEPWYSDYMKLNSTVPNNLSSSSFVPTPHIGVGRGTPEGSGNIADFEQSASAAYFNALQWVITGDNRYADTAVTIFNAWANNLKVVDGRDRILGAGMNSYKLANAAEIIRYYHGGYSGYNQSDFIKFQDMMRNVIYPVIQDLGSPMVANGNWDTNAMVSMMAIGILCDDSVIFDRIINLYQDIHVNGSIAVYVSDSGQSVESVRDQAHAQLGIGYMAEVCEMANNQGIDLYDLYNNRLAKAFEWAAKYNLYGDVTYTPLSNVFGNTSKGYWTQLDSEKLNRGELRPVYELPLSHYRNVEGVDLTWTSKAAKAMRPQGYVHNDELNFGTLTTYNGEVTDVNEPYFLIRTRLEPWYERNLTKDSSGNYVEETLNSYFEPQADGTLTASSQRKDAPFYQLENNGDGTYSIRCITTDTYLSVKDEKVGDYNVIKADAKTKGDNEKFTLYSNGAAFYFLRSPSHDNRIVCVNITDANNNSITSYTNNTSTSTNGTLTTRTNDTITYSSNGTTYSNVDDSNFTLTMYLGKDVSNDISTLTNNEKLILVYNTEEESLKNVSSSVTVTNIDPIDDINVENGTDKDKIGLPEKVDITLSNGVTTSAAVIWDNGNPDYNGDIAGKYIFTGTLKLLDGVTNPDGYKASVDVIVKVSQNQETSLVVAHVDSINDINVENGTDKDEIGLPETVDVTLNDGATTSAAVTWDNGSPDYNEDISGKYTFTGTLKLPDGITNPNGYKANVDIIVEKEDSRTLIPKAVRIKGTERVGQILEAQLLTGSGAKFTTSAGVTYEWYRLSSKNDSEGDLVGEDETYRLVGNDKGKYIKLIATYCGDVFQDIIGIISRKSSSRSSSSSSSSDSSSSTSNSGSTTNTTTTPTVTLSANSDGTVKLTNENGQPLIGWQQIGSSWYLADTTGTAKTGWQLVNNKWYLMASTGIMQTGWQQINGKWYYLYTNGEMASNTTIGDYILGSNGAWIQ